MNQIQTKAFLCALGILGILAGTTSLVIMGTLHPVAFILAAVAIFPMAMYVWKYVEYERHNPIKVLKRVLPKIGFMQEKEEWNDDHTAVRMLGKFRDDNFMIEATNTTLFAQIYDMPWHEVKYDDPIVPRLMEAVNEVNSEMANISVVVCEPDEDGQRQIYTVSRTIIPGYYPANYLESLMCDMLNCKRRLAEAINRERPYMAPRRGPVGFNVSQPADEAASDETMTPAAKTTQQ